MLLLTEQEIAKISESCQGADWAYQLVRKTESAVLEKLKAQEAEKRLLNFSCQLCLDTGFLPKAAILPEPPDIKCQNGCRPNNRHLQPDVLKAQDKGPWKSGKNELDNRVFVQSDDFTHDVRLYIDGDFGGYEERLAYADGIADALNHPLPPADVVRDAERYSFLRDVGQEVVEVFIKVKGSNAPDEFTTWHGYSDMDGAIDAAMEKMK